MWVLYVHERVCTCIYLEIMITGMLKLNPMFPRNLHEHNWRSSLYNILSNMYIYIYMCVLRKISWGNTVANYRSTNKPVLTTRLWINDFIVSAQHFDSLWDVFCCVFSSKKMILGFLVQQLFQRKCLSKLKSNLNNVQYILDPRLEVCFISTQFSNLKTFNDESSIVLLFFFVACVLHTHT